MMAVAVWLVWKCGGFAAPWPAGVVPDATCLERGVDTAVFGLHQPGFACAKIVLLWLAIAATLAAFRPLSRAAAWLPTPQLHSATALLLR